MYDSELHTHSVIARATASAARAGFIEALPRPFPNAMIVSPIRCRAGRPGPQEPPPRPAPPPAAAQLEGVTGAVPVAGAERAVLRPELALEAPLRGAELEPLPEAQRLALPLFERRGPRITLTRVGEGLYQYAMPLVQGMDRLPDTFAEEHFCVVSDALTIGAGQTSAAYLLPRYPKRFRESYPDVRVRVRTGGGSKRMRWLRAYKVDLILLAVDKPPIDLQFHETAVPSGSNNRLGSVEPPSQCWLHGLQVASYSNWRLRSTAGPDHSASR